MEIFNYDTKCYEGVISIQISKETTFIEFINKLDYTLLVKRFGRIDINCYDGYPKILSNIITYIFDNNVTNLIVWYFRPLEYSSLKCYGYSMFDMCLNMDNDGIDRNRNKQSLDSNIYHVVLNSSDTYDKIKHVIKDFINDLLIQTYYSIGYIDKVNIIYLGVDIYDNEAHMKLLKKETKNVIKKSDCNVVTRVVPLGECELKTLEGGHYNINYIIGLVNSVSKRIVIYMRISLNR